MKICLVSQSVSPGFLVFRKDFIRFLISQGHVVYAFAVDFKDDSRKKVKALGAIPVDFKLNKAGLNPFSDIRNTLRLSKQFKAVQADVVFSFFVKPSVYATLAATLARIPRRYAMLEGLGYIHTPSKNGFSFKKRVLQGIHGLLCSVSYAFADKVLFLNQNDAQDLSRVAFLNKLKMQVIGPIGLDLSAYPYRPLNFVNPIRFIFIGRLLTEKGIFEYLSAARHVKSVYPNVEFVVLGGLDPDNPASMSNQHLHEVLAEDIIIYPGHVSNVSDWISASHVFVLPSYREGFPRATQEAMAIGCAVITTDVPGCRETVINGVNGFVVPPWDDRALSEKMIYLIENPNELQRMGLESHRIAVSQYDVHKINPLLASIVTGEMQ